ncbi:MAG: family 16 glycosylhydrolase [Clostridia bacterium]|nr:family 16 glycosylhydrolase [Clostridia bacterium]
MRKRVLSILLCVILLILSTFVPVNVFAATPASPGSIIHALDEPPAGWYKAIERSVCTEPGYSYDGTSVKIDPIMGESLSEIQQPFFVTAGSFCTEGVKIWMRSATKKVIVNLIFQFKDSSGVSGEYAYTCAVTTTGMFIVVPFEELDHSKGHEIDIQDAIRSNAAYMLVKFYKTPIDSIYLDSFMNMEEGDEPVDQDLSTDNEEAVTDPDTLYTPGAESTDSSVISNLTSHLPGYYTKGMTAVLNTNPEKSQYGTSLKLTPEYGVGLSEMQYGYRLGKGSVTGSGIKLWIRSKSQEIVVAIIFSAKDTNGDSGTYTYLVIVTPEASEITIPFNEFEHTSGKEINFSRAMRANLCSGFFKFYKTPIDEIYIDTLSNVPYNEDYECEDPITAAPTQATTTVTTTSNGTSVPGETVPTTQKKDPVWELNWSEEFNGTELDRTVWGYHYGCFRNSEIAYFTDREENVKVENGNLVITTLKENYRNGLADYTSAEVHTQHKKTFLYGRLEMYAKVPYGVGMWPAFWTCGNDRAWPAGGEIDILEMVGGPTNLGGAKGDDVINCGIHYANANGNHASTGGAWLYPGGALYQQYHLYALEWDETELRFYVDDYHIRTIDITADYLSEFREPQFVLINTSIGSGSWATVPDDTTIFPQHYYVDYVRYYVDKNRTSGSTDTTTSTSATESTTASITIESDYKTHEDVIFGISPDTTVADFINNFDINGNGEVKVYNGNELAAATDKISTGSRVIFYKNGAASNEYVAVIYGDITGDGDISASDMLILKNHLLSISDLDRANKLAANVNHDSEDAVNSSDLLILKRHLLSLAQIDQQKG